MRDMIGKTMPIPEFVPIYISDAAKRNEPMFRNLNGYHNSIKEFNFYFY